MNNRIDQNTMDVKLAMLAQTINSDTTTLGEVIDRQDTDDINFSVFFDAFTSGDFVVQILEDDDVAMAGATVIPATLVDGNKYNEVIAPDPITKQAYSYHVHRTMAKRFVRLALVTTDTGVANVHATVILGSIHRSLPNDKNPRLPTS